MSTITKYASYNTVITTGWTNATNAYSEDNTNYATAAPGKGASITTDYGFAAFSTTDIPEGARINSVTVTINWKNATWSTGSLIGLQIDNGGLLGTETTWNQSQATDTDSTKQETTGITLDNLRLADTVQARVRAYRATGGSTAVTFSLDSVRITIDYTPDGIGQALANIKAFNIQGYGQTQALIRQTYQNYGQSQAYISIQVLNYGQAQSNIRVPYYGYGQAQAHILSLDISQYAQTQTQIKTTYDGYGQSQGLIIYRLIDYGQSQAYIISTYTRYGQSQARISKLWSFGQALAQVARYNAYGLALAQVARYNAYGLANARIILSPSYMYVSDTFTRTTSPGWGTADIGGDWVHSNNTYFSTNGTQGIITANTFINRLELKNTVPTTNKYYMEFIWSASSLPSESGGAILFGLWDGGPNKGISGGLKLQPNGVFYIFCAKEGSSSSTSNIGLGTYVAEETWRFKIEYYNRQSTSPLNTIRAKTWKDGTSEPDWIIYTSEYISSVSPQYFALDVDTENFTFTIDNLIITQFEHIYGQALALIDSSIKVSQGQTLAKINAFNVKAYGQARPRIKATIQSIGQSQAQILGESVTIYSSGQALGQIIVIYNYFGQTLAQIKQTYFGYAQSIAYIQIVGQGYAQTQAIISVIYSGYAQAQAQIKQIYQAFGQSLAQIKQTYFGYVQAIAHIKKTEQGYAQAQSQISAQIVTYYEYGQAQAQIKQIYIQYGQALGHIKVTNINSYSQAQAQIKVTYQSYGQVLAQIQSIYQKHGLALSRIKQTYPYGGGTLVALDNFTESGTGEIDLLDHTADLGGTYSVFYRSTSNVSFILDRDTDKAASKSINSGDSEVSYKLSDATLSDGSLYFSYIFGSIVPNDYYNGVLFRVNGNNGYGVFLTPGWFWFDRVTSGTANLVKGGDFTQINDLGVAQNFSSGDTVNVRVDISGNSPTIVRVKQWNANDVEPHNWGRLGFDSSYFYQLSDNTSGNQYTSGAIGFYAYPDPNRTHHFDNFYAIEGIGVLRPTFAQSQAQILAVSQSFGQAQAQIESIAPSMGHSQSLALIGTTTALYSRIDEASIDDNDYIVAPSGISYYEVALEPLPTPDFLIDHFIRVRACSNSTPEVIVKLYQGTTYICEFTLPSLTPSFQTFTYKLSEAQITSITDYSNLRLRFNVDSGTDRPIISWAEFQTPFGSGIKTRRVYAQALATILAAYTTYNTYGQAQAVISRTEQAYAHAQGYIIVRSINAYAQALAHIRRTEQSYAQTQAQIRQTYQAFGQSQSIIKATYQSYGQSQAQIRQTYQTYGQAQGLIRVLDNKSYANAQGQIKQTYQVYGQAQGQIRQTYYGYGQSLAQIKATYQYYGQAMAQIRATYTYYGQALAQIRATYQSYGQAQAQILTAYFGYAQAMAHIKVTNNYAYGQALANIKQTYQSFGQAQGVIRTTNQVFGQSLAQIVATYQITGQAQATIRATYQVFANTQAHILQTYQAYGQAQATILNSYQAYAQAQAKVNAFNVQHYGQASAWLSGTNLTYGQAQAKINAIAVKEYGQALADIKQTYQVYAQALASITGVDFGQAQATILATYQSYAQAQSAIRGSVFAQAMAAVRGNTFAQAQAYIKVTANNVYGQALAQIRQTYFVYAQTQAQVRATYAAYGQSLAQIKATYLAYGQAQAQILTAYQSYGQAQAQILQTYAQYGQAQADIKATYQGYAQAQAVILNAYQGYAQAQAQVKQTYQVFGQSAAIILQTYAQYGQAQSLIVASYFGYAQTLAHILVTANQVFGQSLATILTTNNGYSQSQAKIYTPQHIRPDRDISNGGWEGTVIN